MSEYEINLNNAKESDKIIYYDYLAYKRAAGWKTPIDNTDWIRPSFYKLKKASYNADFLQNLPDYYFLGFPVKYLIRTNFSRGHCHACAVALSLYFKDFYIVTCNLNKYIEYYNEHTEGAKLTEFEHTILVTNIDGKKFVIDTTGGFITDLETYEEIFGLDNLKVISSVIIKNTDIYKYIESRKYTIGPSKDDELHNNESAKEYDKELENYMNMCKSYKNEQFKHLEDFINRCLYRTSNTNRFYHWRIRLHYRQNNRELKYPTCNMFSIDDDKDDMTLDGRCKSTIERNKQTLENYYKPVVTQEIPLKKKNKIFSFDRNDIKKRA